MLHLQILPRMMMYRNLPNLLTLLRMLLVIPFAYMLFWQPVGASIWWALIIFVIASLTDYFDGSLARKYNLISAFGKIMDPLADKLLVLTAIAGLCFVPPWSLPKAIFYIIFGRELLVTVLREVYKKRGIIVPADKLGKLKTVLQMLGIIVALLVWRINPGFEAQTRFYMEIWFWMVCAITIISGLNYLRVKKEQ